MSSFIFKSTLTNKVRIAIAMLPLIACLANACSTKRASNEALFNPEHKSWQTEAPEHFNVFISTTKGKFVLEIHKAWAPIGVNRFYNLVRLGYFDNSRFFRVRKGYITQFGIPGSPSITQIWQNQTIQDDPVRHSNLKGTIAYAMTGPNTRTTQLFINYKDNAHLDDQGFAPLGAVVKGMDVVDQLYAGYDEGAGGGMRGGKQGKMFSGGNEYLDKEFPKLDKLLRAEIIMQ